MILIAVGALTVAVAAVSGIAVTELTNSEVESGQSTSHTLSFDADEVSADGTMDMIYIEFPDEYAGNISFSTASVTNRSSGATVPISSSTNIVDGPDGDGIRDTLRTGISKDADYATDDISATYQFGLSHPAVMETTQYDVTITMVDSQTGNATATVEDAITVRAGSEMTMAGDDDSMDDNSDTTDQQQTTDMATDGQTTTKTGSGGGPGFGMLAAIAGVLVGAILLGRQY